MRRTTALCLALAASLTLTACGGNTREEGILARVSGLDPEAAALSVDGREVSARQALYWLAYTCDYIAAACDGGIHGVCIVFNGRVILGTRARKTHSKSFDAFSSINYPNIADVRDGRLMRYIEPECFARPRFYTRLDTRVALLKLIPGTGPELLRYMLEGSRALIIESFGVGGLPERGGMHELVKAAALSGKAVVMTTQVQNEGSDLAVYGTGSALARSPGVLEAWDMTTEAAVAKLMWLLPQVKEPGDIPRLFYTPVSKDILSMPG